VMLRGNGGHDIFFDDEDRYHLYLLIRLRNRGQNTVFANILGTIRDNKPYGGDKCRANQDLSYLEFRNMLYNGGIIASQGFCPCCAQVAYTHGQQLSG
jgi:hypothetical protein